MYISLYFYFLSNPNITVFYNIYFIAFHYENRIKNAYIITIA